MWMRLKIWRHLLHGPGRTRSRRNSCWEIRNPKLEIRKQDRMTEFGMFETRTEQITSLDDPRIAPYRNLKDRDLAGAGDRFIAEGGHVVQRLMQSDYPVESVLLAQ